MTGRLLAWLAIGSCGTLLLCSGMVGAVLTGGTGAPAGCYAPIATISPVPSQTATSEVSGAADAVGQWSAEQVRNAKTIVTTGAHLGIPAEGWVVAVATAMQESGLRNLPAGDRDSVGLFQQRPSQGWGTVTQLTDPVYASTKFYQALLRVDGWQNMALTEASQAVQVSAYPDAYAKWEHDAITLVRAAAGVASANSGAIPADLEQCVSTAGWSAPVRAPIVSGFRTAERPEHDGVDLGAPNETPVRAVNTGEVITARCDTDPSGKLCNRPGSPSTPGCGWYVKIRHAGDVVTMYCHLVRAPVVRVGQIVAARQEIGQVGSSGHSSGPHLHFEVHRIEGSTSQVVDPLIFMRQQGVELGS